jgi:lipopolysaccharide/colanic/teichoic acid biosynthesis glycosyltransferase
MLSSYSFNGRRIFDVTVSAAALCLLFLPTAAIVAAIKLNMGGPVLLKQPRTGLNGNTFHMLKFRSMNDNKDKNGKLLPDAMRVTELGRWLRRWSLDEIPQLLNVLGGNMSIVGPRPWLPNEVKTLRTEGRQQDVNICLSVLPGIAGPHQAIQRRPNYEHGETVEEFNRKRLEICKRYVLRKRQNPWRTDFGILSQAIHVLSEGKKYSTDPLQLR